MKDTEKIQLELCTLQSLKIIIFGKKNMLNEINSILEIAKEKISKLKDVAIEIILRERIKMTEQK